MKRTLNLKVLSRRSTHRRKSNKKRDSKNTRDEATEVEVDESMLSHQRQDITSTLRKTAILQLI